MADIKPAPPKLFEFTARTVTSGQTNVLEIDVRNDTGAALVAPLFIEFNLPTGLLTPPVQQAAIDAQTSEAPSNMATLGGVVNAPEGWTVWAINVPADSPAVVFRVFNNLDRQTGEIAETTTRLDAGAALTLRVPLSPEAARAQFTLGYGYQTGKGSGRARVDGSLELTPSHLDKWDPKVSLTCDHTSPTLLPPGQPVKISWGIKGGVAATLRGPLPGGNSELTLSRDQTSSYKMEEGWLTINAVGPATYVLDAEVQSPDGGPNVQVVRTLTLDIYSADKYASLSVRPGNVLPNGQVDINWAVWGVKQAALKVGDRLQLRLNLTEQNLGGWYQGAGTWRVNARANQPTETVRLYIVTRDDGDGDEDLTDWKDANMVVTRWEKLERNPVFTGKPLALAVAEGQMALLTHDGLWTAPVGKTDADLKNPAFTKSPEGGKAWHALAAFGRDFVVLRQTAGDDIVLERYDAKGQRVPLPVTLPPDFQTLARRDGTVFDLVGYGNRVYVVAEAPASGGWARCAYSVRLDPQEHVRPEAALASLIHYHLVNFGGALYAYQRRSGRMLRFGLKQTGELEPPTRAASAVNAEGVSMIKTGLLVPARSVLAVLDPAALPAFDAVPLFALQNVAGFNLQNLKPQRKAAEIPQDLVYNPQKDRWTACGHGLEMKAGAVAAYRGGDSERLWVLQPDGEMYKLAGATEKLFAPSFFSKFPPKPLPPALDATREFALGNMTGFNLVPLDDVCRANGLEGFSANGFAELTPWPGSTQSLQRASFKLAYDSAHTTSATLRFMLPNLPGARYVLEINFSGAGLGTVNSVFKRLTPTGRLDDVPGTAQTHPANETNIILRQAGPLHEKTRFLILNAAPEELRLSPAVGLDKVQESAAVEVRVDTPDFKISLPNAESIGHLWATFDFAQPAGIEMSPRNQVQRKRIRIATTGANLLEPSADFLETIPSIVFTFERYDGSRSGRMPQPTNAYWCRVGVKNKVELDGVRIGDAVATRDGKSIFVTLARPENVKKIRIVRIDTDSLATSELAVETKGGVFSAPNAVAVSDNYYYAMFGETVWHQATHKFEYPFTMTLEGYKEIVAFAASPAGHVYYVSKTETGFGEGRRVLYSLWYLPFPNQSRTEIPLTPISFPVNVPPLAVSPDGNTAAVCDQGGLLVVDVINKKVQAFRPGNLSGPAHVVFSHDGQWIYCAHLTGAFNVNPRRVVSGRDITVTRVRTSNLNDRQTISLPNVEGNFSVTGNTKQSFGVNVSSKEQVALTLAVSPDNRFLFVSAGTTIMKIATDSFTLHPWRKSVELPCRLITVKKAGADAYTVYALGSHYLGDGTTVDEYKTQLYFVPAPVS
jgi:hypothetical protein